VPEGKRLMNDAAVDAFIQQILNGPAEYDVVAAMNLNGDYVYSTI